MEMVGVAAVLKRERVVVAIDGSGSSGLASNLGSDPRVTGRSSRCLALKRQQQN